MNLKKINKKLHLLTLNKNRKKMGYFGFGE